MTDDVRDERDDVKEISSYQLSVQQKFPGNTQTSILIFKYHNIIHFLKEVKVSSYKYNT